MPEVLYCHARVLYCRSVNLAAALVASQWVSVLEFISYLLSLRSPQSISAFDAVFCGRLLELLSNNSRIDSSQNQLLELQEEAALLCERARARKTLMSENEELKQKITVIQAQVHMLQDNWLVMSNQFGTIPTIPQ